MVHPLLLCLVAALLVSTAAAVGLDEGSFPPAAFASFPTKKFCLGSATSTRTAVANRFVKQRSAMNFPTLHAHRGTSAERTASLSSKSSSSARDATSAAMATAVLLAGALPALVVPTAVVAADDADVARGSQLFTSNCASCHAGGINVIKPNKTLRKEALEKFLGSVDADTVQKFVMGSGQHKRLVFPGVPGGKLSEQDYADAAAFIVDQATGDKW